MTIEHRKRTDWELVESTLAGSHDAFAVLVSRYERQVANLVYLSLGNPSDVHDVMQEIFLRFYQSLGRLTERDTVFPWLYRIAANLCVDESRKRSVRKLLSLDFLLEKGAHPEGFRDDSRAPHHTVEDKELREQILTALGKLPAASRIVLVMRDYEDLTYQEISQVLGLSLSMVKTRLFRARRRLGELLSNR